MKEKNDLASIAELLLSVASCVGTSPAMDEALIDVARRAWHELGKWLERNEKGGEAK